MFGHPKQKFKPVDTPRIIHVDIIECMFTLSRKAEQLTALF